MRSAGQARVFLFVGALTHWDLPDHAHAPTNQRSDRRFGAQGQMVATNMQRIFKMNEKLFVGMSGLATDVQTL